MARGGFRPGAGRPKGAKKGIPVFQPMPLPADSVTAPVKAKTPLPDPEYAEMIGAPIPPALGPNSIPVEDQSEVSEEPDCSEMTPLEYALMVMRNPKADTERRDRLCIALLPYMHQRVADIRPTTKDNKRRAAESASQSLFSTAAPPKLKAVK
jgi:phage terminase small subunit